jgi:hypothetical protein
MIRRRYQRKSSNPVPSVEWCQRVTIIYDLCMPLLHSRFRTWSTDDCMDAFHSAIVRCLDSEETLAPLPDDQLCKKILSWTGGELPISIVDENSSEPAHRNLQTVLHRTMNRQNPLQLPPPTVIDATHMRMFSLALLSKSISLERWVLSMSMMLLYRC